MERLARTSSWRAGLVAVACTVLVGCQTLSVVRQVPLTLTPAAPAPPAPAAPTAATVAPATATRPPTAAAAQSPVAAGSPSPIACQYGPTRRLADAQDRTIQEASGLAASTRWPGIYWTLNDSGNHPTVYALDEQGRSRGTFRVDGADNEDWEALGLGPGRDGGSALYVGDIGDNDAERRDIVIYRVPEPEPMPAGARTANARTAKAEEIKLQYPSGARDAEGLLIHPTTGEILIVTKEKLGHAGIYRVPVPLDTKRTVRMEQVADVEMARFGVKIDVVTDAAVAPDGSRVTIRTYGSLLEYDVPSGAALASIWGQAPRVARLDDGTQGEGITYRADGRALISIGEITPARLHETPWSC